MTIITVKDGIMAADTASFSGVLQMAAQFPKITRGTDRLGASCGEVRDCFAFQEWIRAGASGDKEPTYYGKGDDEVSCLQLLTNGSVWRKDGNGPWYPVPEIYTLGHQQACMFADGAMAAGATAEEAVRLTIERVAYTGGSVQVERLE